jgi:hypothetical protein
MEYWAHPPLFGEWVPPIMREAPPVK